jgi:hypothetical protein
MITKESLGCAPHDAPRVIALGRRCREGPPGRKARRALSAPVVGAPVRRDRDGVVGSLASAVRRSLAPETQ